MLTLTALKIGRNTWQHRTERHGFGERREVYRFFLGGFF